MLTPLISMPKRLLATVTDYEHYSSYDLGHYRGQAAPQPGYVDQVKKASEGARKFREFKKMRGKG